MQPSFSILMAQINPTVGAIHSNAEKIISIINKHQGDHDLIVFPELALTGYPPEDLLFRNEFHEQVAEALKTIQSSVKNCHVVVGHPSIDSDHIYNSASVIANGESLAVYHKQNLPNYGVFDEKRYFTSGPAVPCTFHINNHRFGLCICEDLWVSGPVEQLVTAKVETMICINASPFDEIKYTLREALLRTHTEQGLDIIYVNLVGGQDELVFDGQSLVMDRTGRIKGRAPAFKECLHTIQLKNGQYHSEITPILEQDELLYKALVCGLKDYVEKNGFPGVLLGLSGGIDSALTLCIAVDAIGASRVQAVSLPSRYSAKISGEDALLQAKALGVSYTILPIEPAFETLLGTLAPVFNGLPIDITEENLQARIRGVLLMALSNKSDKMLLTTSNKSEAAVGYSTLYGDMAGGFAVLKDVLKTLVYTLARYRNTIEPVIPERVFTRAPSAELAENQTDQDNLPDYAILDEILTAYMNDNLSAEEIIKRGYAYETVQKVIRLIKRNEYKRRQAAPGVKITTCAFGKDWRYPLTSGF